MNHRETADSILPVSKAIFITTDLAKFMRGGVAGGRRILPKSIHCQQMRLHPTRSMARRRS